MSAGREPGAVRVRDLTEARRVLDLAAALGLEPLLVTERGAHAFLGPAYLLEMMRQAGARRALIDCGRDAGSAMLALRLGWRDLHLDGEPDTVRRLAQMTAAAGGRFHARLPPAFEPDAGRSADDRLRAWLQGRASN